MERWKRSRNVLSAPGREVWLNVWHRTALVVGLSCAVSIAGCTEDEWVAPGTRPGNPIVTPSCGGGPRLVGSQKRQVRTDDRTRTFISYVPQRLDPRRPAPLVLVFHGALMSGASMRDLTGFEQVAEQEGFIAVFPDGDADRTWNIRPNDTHVCGIGELFTNPDSDDFQFVDDMIAEVETSHCIDRDHIFATGFSMGGYFSNHLACERPELVRAVATHGSGTFPGACKGRVPMLMVHGTADFVIGEPCRNESRTRWVERNGCSSQFESEPVKKGVCEHHLGCPNDGGVTFCLFDGLCHGWSGRGTGELFCLEDFGPGPTYEDATRLTWRFFKDNW